MSDAENQLVKLAETVAGSYPAHWGGKRTSE